MEAVIAILVLIGVLSASGLLPERSPPTAHQDTQTTPLEISEQEVRPACNQHESVYLDGPPQPAGHRVPSRQRTSVNPVGEMEGSCDE